MRLQRFLPALAAALSLTLICAQAAPCGRPDNEVYVPGDRVFTLELLSPISTETNKKGDEFTCRVLDPSEYVSAYVSGRITKIKGSGKATGKSEIAMAFDTITLADGRGGKFSAQILEVYDIEGAGNKGQADPEGTVKGKSRRKREALEITAATAIGALIGGLLGGAKGAVIGGAIGAGIAVTNTLSTRGPNMRFDTGTQFSVRTDSKSGSRR